MNRSPATWAVALLLASAHLAGASPDGPFDRFDLPDAWEARFWSEENADLLRRLDLKVVADLVPSQAGFRNCRCPRCGAGEAEDPLSWSLDNPDLLACRKCNAPVPDAEIPAKVDNKVPEEVVEVLPRQFHHYPYHNVEAEKQLYPDERIYLQAKRDYLVSRYLAKFALYAAVKHREANDPELARRACVILLRFAQVYPSYATHYDHPGRPKYLDRADLPPPYRRDYGTGKWDREGCLDVPLDLVIAHALLRDDPAMAEAGRLLNDPHPARAIEKHLFRASAEFVIRQPPDQSASALYAIRGILAVGRLLDDPAMVREGMGRLNNFLDRGFYHDGVWKQGDGLPQRRVLGQMDGWIDRFLAGYPAPPGPSGRGQKLSGIGDLPMIALARSAEAASAAPGSPEVTLASWPAPAPKIAERRPALLGGAGIARLGVGSGADALDLDMRGLGDFGNAPSARLSLRLRVGGHAVLGDLEDAAAFPWGFDLATASHNAVVVDGLNQRESLGNLRDPAAGSDILFFAADPDFQVAMMGDRLAYPRSANVYRHILIAASGAKTRYAVSVFEVRGGLQHDQLYHAAPGLAARWQLSVPTAPGPDSLLPDTMKFLPEARAEDGRWFVQAMGAFSDLSRANLDRPIQAELKPAEAPGVRLHLFPTAPGVILSGASPEPSADGRAALIVHRRSRDGAALDTVFVTVFEPLGASVPLKRVGRVAGPEDAVVLALETAEGPEFLVVNLKASSTIEVKLPDGRLVRTDGLAVRVSPGGPILAGGTFADVGGRHLAQTRASGKVVAAQPARRGQALGVFTVEAALPDPASLAGRALLIRHGNGTTRGWTIASAENLREGGAKIYVRERVGFHLDPPTGDALYDQFPSLSAPGPHEFGISKMIR